MGVHPATVEGYHWVSFYDCCVQDPLSKSTEWYGALETWQIPLQEGKVSNSTLVKTVLSIMDKVEVTMLTSIH